MNEKYFLYARKSTDVEDKQVLSIEAQIAELRKYARDNNLHIVDTIIEKRTAKTPGRPKFGTMLKRIEANEASGIVAWHPDRLARNSIDGGQIVYLLDQTHLTNLKFPTFWFENTSQGKFMLSIAFGQSKYYVDNLSENTKRGLRQKVRRGEMPGLAPLGYINDVRTRTIVVDKRRAPLVVSAFELYSKGDKGLQEIADYFAENGIKTSGGLPLKKDQIKYMLINPFYYGHFRYAGEVYEGKHTPIMTKKLFDAVQSALEQRGHKRKGANAPQALCGLLACGACNMAITAEKKIKHQKNGNIHEYTYYRCTRKSKTMKCVEPAVTEPQLVAQLSDILQGYALPSAWATTLHKMLDEDEKTAEQTTGAFIAQAQEKVRNLQSKLQRLLDGYLDQDIDQPTYKAKQAELMSEKKSLEEQIGKLTLAAGSWVEPMRQWIKQAVSLKKIAENAEPVALKQAFAEINGLNLFLSKKQARLSPRPNSNSPQENIWLALRAAKEKAAQMGDQFLKSPKMAGYEWVEPKAANRLGIPICNIVAFNTQAVAEWAVMMMFNLARQTPRLIKDGFPLDFDKDFSKYRGIQLKGKTAGIIGLGNIGSAIAERCAGLGMNVVYWSRSSTNDKYKKLSLEELLSTADVILPATAKNDETVKLVNDDMIRTIKKDAMVVDIVHAMFNHQLLVDMVASGDLYGYGFEGEPKDFAKFEGNVWAAPAYAWATYESMYNSVAKLVDNIVNASKGEFPTRVNK